jgi:hypothetical protein
MPAEPSLTSLFIPHVRPAERELAARPELELCLVEVLASAREAWPDLKVPKATFLRYLAERLPKEGSVLEALRRLHAADLYLTCACTQGLSAAQALLDARFLPKVDAAVARVQGVGDMAAEVRQRLRGRWWALSLAAALALAGVGVGAWRELSELSAVDDRIPVTIGVDESTTVEAPGMARLAVEDPAIVDVVADPAGDQLRLIALSPGVTTVIVWTKEKTRRAFLVTVKSR